MSLRRQNLSPTANLLRNSRLFSLPNALPRPLVAVPYGAGSLRASDTATLPYPTHQAIATTPSSLARGDWGLKRPIPSRSRLVQTSNPVLRVEQWDTVEHVTDFDSAADHVRTKQKFEEMSVPLMKGFGSFQDHDLTTVAPTSAFESRADITSYDSDEGLDGAGVYLEALKESAIRNAKAKRTGEKTASKTARFTVPNLPEYKARQANVRWKHEGPWLPGMSADDFTVYLSNKLSHRRTEFNNYLVEYVKVQIYNARSNSTRRNETTPMDPVEAEMWLREKEKEWSSISRSDVNAEIRALRAECAADPLNSKLVQKLIIPFLRLPPVKLKSTEYAVDRGSNNQRFSDETTPSSTHPSAGLGYLRTKSWLANHPILGPQARPAPVTARIVQPKKTATGTESRARLGVAGFVANDEWKGSGMQHDRTAVAATERLDVDTEGGAKLAVHPMYAAVSPDGKVNIKLIRTYDAELKVAQGQLDDKPPQRENVEVKPLDNLDMGMSGVPELDAQAQEKTNKELNGFLKIVAQQQEKMNQSQR